VRIPVPASRLARYELRRFRGPLPKVALVFVLIIPLLYGAIYLTANWDPYGRLDQLPVAVVDQDQPVTYEGKEVHAGQDFVDTLMAKKDFDYAAVDEPEAMRGLQEGDYYLAIVVPADFSAHLISGAGDDPERAQIMLRRNDANGFVIGSITARAQDGIARAVDESAVASYFDAVFANLATIRSGLQDAADGAGQLSDGASSADDGAAKVADGAKSAAAGSKTLANGADDLSAGLGTAKTGSADLAKGLRTLKSGSAGVATGAGKVADGTQQLDDAVVPVLTDLQKNLPQIQSHAKEAGSALDDVTSGLADRTGSVSADLSSASDALDELKKDNPDLADDENFQRVQDRVDSAAKRSGEIADTAQNAADDVHAINTKIQQTGDLTKPVTEAKDKLVDLNDGAHQVASGARQVRDGVASASSGADTLATGVSSAAAGADKLAAGAGTLHTGLTTLSTGAADLHAGTTKLAAGAAELHDKLSDAVKRVPAISADEQADAVQVLSSPADVTMQVDNPAGVYGRGLAPMFFSIAIWVFGISVFLVVRPISGRALAGRARPWRLALTGWLPIGIFAVLGALLMLGVVWLFLGLAPVHPLMIIGLTALGAVCFSSIAHLLRSGLGTPGSSILLVWLILQLTSAGGTYPAPVLPVFFQAIAPYMPMTYLIDAYRVVISGGELSHLARDATILLIGTLLALGLGVLVVRKRQQFALRDLHPPLVSP
jgi:putative membrane protein